MPPPAKPPEEGTPGALKLAAWDSIPGLVHGFFGRDGGYSTGARRGLNLSEKVGDDPDIVARNWSLVTGALPSLRLVRMSQVHGALVVLVGRDQCTGNPAAAGECDGLLTGDPGLGLTVMTADCVPILLVAPEHRVVMALHAGWRGTIAGIAGAGIGAARQALGIPENEWQAALGPAIGGCCYQVSAEIGESFTKRWGAMPDAWQRSGEHGQLDLRRVNARILAVHGVREDSIHAVGPCTACDHQNYFSHRQSRGSAGRQVSLIGFDGKIGIVSASDDR